MWADADPPHKTLFGTENRRGLPIGNLTSQFFSNVYLNELDQFVKHRLRARHYLRYSDDFVLVHEDPAQLLAWRGQIQTFLAERLRLTLTDALASPQPISNGVNFLGYIVRPDYLLVRRRVVSRLKRRLRDAEQQLVRPRSGFTVPARGVTSTYAGRRDLHSLGDWHALGPGGFGFSRRDRTDAFEGVRRVIAVSALVADADRDLFENHEAGFVLERFAVNPFALHSAAAKLTAVSEEFLHGHGDLFPVSGAVTHEARRTRVCTGRFFEGRRSRLPRKFRISKPMIEPSVANEYTTSFFPTSLSRQYASFFSLNRTDSTLPLRS
jgi:hypothetical protein